MAHVHQPSLVTPERAEDTGPSSKLVGCPWAAGCPVRVTIHFLGGSPALACAPAAIWASRKGTEPQPGQEPTRVKNLEAD